MSHLDDELRNALRREEPPEGFVNRVLERLPAEPPRATVARPGVARTWLAAAAAVILATGAMWVVFPHAPRPNIVRSVIEPKPELPAESPRPAPTPAPAPTPTPAPAPTAPNTTTPSTPKRPPRPMPRRDSDDAEALHAAEQLRTALGVTSEKFRLTQREVREALVIPES